MIGIIDGASDIHHDNLFYKLCKKSVMAVGYGTDGKSHGTIGVAISPLVALASDRLRCGDRWAGSSAGGLSAAISCGGHDDSS